MSAEEKKYLEIGRKFDEAEESQMFGKPCFKVHSKAFIAFFQDCLVCKLTGDAHKEALALKGSQLFDPSGKKRPMKERVQIPFIHKGIWQKYAKASYEYLQELTK